VCLRLGVTALEPAVAGLIRDKAEGHPFFSEELAYALRDAGLVVVVDGVCQVTPGTGDLGALNFPDTLEEVIVSRVDRLTASQQLALKVASVIGRLFTYRTLRDVHPIEVHASQLADDLNALHRLDITLLQSSEPDLAYLFKHVITQEVAYNLMLFAQRRQLHRAVAEWYERTYADDPSPYYPLLAHHWSNAAGKPTVEPSAGARAIHYLEKAGEQAMRRYANAEAVRFLEEALELDRQVTPPEHAGGSATQAPPAWRQDAPARRLTRARWERLLGEAYFRLGKAPEAREHLRRALALMGEPVPTTSGKLLTSLAGQLARQAVHRLVPGGFVGRASGERREILLEAARAHETLALVAYVAMEKVPCLDGNLRGLNLAEAAGPSPELAHSYAMVGLLAGAVGQAGLADGYFRRALDVGERVGDRFSLGRVWMTKGLHEVGQGRWAETRAAFDQARRLFESLGDHRWRETTVLGWGLLEYLRGEYAAALARFADGFASAHQRGDPQSQAWGMSGEASARLLLGQVDRALSVLDELEARTPIRSALASDPAAELNVLANRALAYAWRGERELAMAALEVAARQSEQHPPSTWFAVIGYGQIAEVGLLQWETADSAKPEERERAAAMTSRARARLQQFARLFPIGLPRMWLSEGSYRWLAGNTASAHKAWQKGLAAAERLEMPYEQGVAHYEIGRHLSDDVGRHRHLAHARELLARIGATYNVARVDEALAASFSLPRSSR
jgi:tetratricopeptide (TPR) repeat protein